MITFPKFAFDFPAVWNVEEEVTPTGETVTISNERGAKVTYSHLVGVPVGEDATGRLISIYDESGSFQNRGFKFLYLLMFRQQIIVI